MYISKKLRKQIETYVNKKFPEEVATRNFDRYLFPSRNDENKPLARESLWRIISNAGDRVGLKNIGTQVLLRSLKIKRALSELQIS